MLKKTNEQNFGYVPFIKYRRLKALEFYRNCLFYPMWLPILLIPFMSGRSHDGLIPAIDPIADYILFQSVFGAVPFIITSIIYRILMGNIGIQKIKKVLKTFPIALYIVSIPFLHFYCDPKTYTYESFVDAWIPCTIITFVVGYLYIWLVYRIGERKENRAVGENEAIQNQPVAI